MLSFKSLARLNFVGFLALFLSGCFQPLYAPFNGRDVSGKLAAIYIVPVPDRLGHYIESELAFGFNGSGAYVAPRYKLEITPRERVQTPLVDTVSGRATAGTVIIDANYRLTETSTGELVTEGTAFTAASYDRSSQRFANIRAARDAEIRDAKTLADQIRTRISARLAARN